MTKKKNESVVIEFEYLKTKEIVDKLEGRDFNEVVNDRKSKLSNIWINSQTKDNEEKQQIDESNIHHEEEEMIEIGGGFDDIFN